MLTLPTVQVAGWIRDGKARPDEASETFFMLYAYRNSQQEDLSSHQLRILNRLVREELG